MLQMAMVGKTASPSGKGSRCVDSRVCPSKKDFKVLQAFQANSVEQVSSPSVVAIVLTFIFVTIYFLNSESFSACVEKWPLKPHFLDYSKS